MTSHRNARGFTLIEILVVVSILGVLMGLVSVLVLRSAAKQKEETTKMLVTSNLRIAIDRYKQEFKVYPPMSLKQLNSTKKWKDIAYVDNNEINESSECLLVALRHPDFTARFEEDALPGDTSFGNTDEDEFNQIPAGSDDLPALEICDAWGNPIVYIEKNGYGKTYRVINGEGEEVEVQALRKPDGQTWYNATSYQLISLGENGKQDLDDPELSDDIVNFKWRGGE